MPQIIHDLGFAALLGVTIFSSLMTTMTLGLTIIRGGTEPGEFSLVAKLTAMTSGLWAILIVFWFQ